jgi:hypothetical protein
MNFEFGAYDIVERSHEFGDCVVLGEHFYGAKQRI